MAKIKTREKLKGIKTLDRTAMAGQHTKDAYVRTIDRASQLTEDHQDSGTNYAQNQVQYAAGDAAYAAAAGARLAVNKTKQAIRERKEIKTAEQYHAAPRPYYEAPDSPNTIRGTSPLDRMAGSYQQTPTTSAYLSGQTPRQRRPVRPANLQYTMAQYRAREEAYRNGILEMPDPDVPEAELPTYRSPRVRPVATDSRATPSDVESSASTVERGRQLAVSKARQSAAERQKIRQREQYSPKTRDRQLHTKDSSPREPNLPDGRANYPQATGKIEKKANASRARKVRSRTGNASSESMAHRASARQNRTMPSHRERIKLFRRRQTDRRSIRTREDTVLRRNVYSPAYRNTPLPKSTFSAHTAAQPVESASEAGSRLKHVRAAEKTIKSKAKSAGKNAFKTPSRSIKSTGRSIKTAEHTSNAVVKTAQQSAAATKKAAIASAKAAKKAATMAKYAAEKAAQAAKAAAKATAKAIKAIIAALEELIAAIVAGGWAAAVIVIVVCLLGLIVASCFGIFFSGEDTGTGMTMNQVIREINGEYQARIEEIKADNPHDELVISGSRAIWKEVLAVYAVKTTSDPNNPMEVASMTEEKKELLRDIFWSMTVIDYHTETVVTTEEVEAEDEDGNPVTEEVEVQTVYLYITTNGKTADEMAAEYGFDEKQTDQLHELLSTEYDSLWTAVLYGIGSSDEEIVNVALSQLGNVGGQPYWSWYGFGSRVAWCACFVSWCADQCGYIEAGIIPKFSVCDDGIYWFQNRGQWAGNDVEPSPGWIIFFDWDLDGYSDHVGIVEYCEGGYVHTVEGNTSGDVCKQNVYAVGESDVMGVNG